MSSVIPSVYSGIRLCLSIVNLYGEDTIYDEIMNAVADDDVFIACAKIDEEYEWCGLDRWEKRKREKHE